MFEFHRQMGQCSGTDANTKGTSRCSTKSALAVEASKRAKSRGDSKGRGTRMPVSTRSTITGENMRKHEEKHGKTWNVMF